MHGAAQRTLEVLGELGRVGEGTPHPEHSGAVRARLDPLLQRLGPVLRAPRVGRADPEQLLGRVVLQAGQPLLLPVTGHPAEGGGRHGRGGHGNGHGNEEHVHEGHVQGGYGHS